MLNIFNIYSSLKWQCNYPISANPSAIVKDLSIKVETSLEIDEYSFIKEEKRPIDQTLILHLKLKRKRIPTSCMARMTECCTASSMPMMRWMYSCFSSQLTAQPRMSCSRRPSSTVSLCSPEYVRATCSFWQRFLIGNTHNFVDLLYWNWWTSRGINIMGNCISIVITWLGMKTLWHMHARFAV